MNDWNKSWWLETLPGPITPNPAPEGTVKTDVAVIGGGFTGLSTAYHLKKLDPGLEVRLLESHICGYGASGRNGGFSMTLFGLTKGITRFRFGDARARAAHAYMEQAVDYLYRLVQEQQLDPDYEATGYLLVATSKAQEKRLEHDFKLAEKWQLEGIERWDRARLQQEFHTDLYRLGWFEPRCGILNPAKQARAMKALAEREGAIIHEQSPVTRIRRGADRRFLIKTPEGEVQADYLVLATNAYSIAFPELRSKQTPVFTHIVLTEPLTDAQMQAIGWQNRAGVEDARNFIHYYRLTRDNRIVMGGGDVTLTYGTNLDRDLNERTFRHLEQHITEVYPQLRGIRITHRWGGPVSITTDMAPVIGFLGEDRRALFSVGCIGHGVSMTHLNGLTMAELICGKKTERTEMFFVGRKVIPWPPEPIRFAVGHLIRGYMRLEDRLLYK